MAEPLYRLAPKIAAGPTRITEDCPSCWHGCSTGGNTLVFCTGRAGNCGIDSIPAEGGVLRIIAGLFGGQGTINVPSWNLDSTHITCVHHQPEEL
jgi:Tol biopolymer transport system component